MNQKRYSNSLKRFELILTSTNTLPCVKYVEGCLIFDLFYAMSKNQPSGPTVYMAGSPPIWPAVSPIWPAVSL